MGLPVERHDRGHRRRRRSNNVTGVRRRTHRDLGHSVRLHRHTDDDGATEKSHRFPIRDRSKYIFIRFFIYYYIHAIIARNVQNKI